MKSFSREEFNRLFDHTLLKPYATGEMLAAECRKAAEYGFATIAINSGVTAECVEYLKGTDVKVDAAIGFPLGITTVAAKVAETRDAIACGAGEIDYVLNIGKLKEHNLAYITEEMKAIVTVCREAGVTSKVIFENCYLTDEEKDMACEAALLALPDFIKTSTGFGPTAATVEDVRRMKNAVGDKIRVKAAGGVRTLDAALAMIEAGAQRIGCSASIAICDAYAARFLK